MKTQVWVYVVVAVLSLGAGVAIAGLPTFEDREPTIQPPTETTTTTTTTTSTVAPSTTEAPAVESDDVTSESLISTGDDESDDEADENDAPEEPAVTEAATETSTTTTTTVPTPLAQRDELDVVVVNAAERAGVASLGSDLLEEVGYVDVGAFDGSEIFDVTVVFAAGGVQGEAERLAQEVGIQPDLIFPIDTAPTVSRLRDGVQLMVYVGRDARELPFFN